MATSLGKHPSYNIQVSYEVSVNNSYSNTQAQVTFKFIANLGSQTSVQSSGVKVKVTCDGSTKGSPDALVGCGTSSTSSGNPYTKSYTFTINKGDSSKSVSYTAYAYTQNGSTSIGSHSSSVTINAKTIESYSHTINHYFIGFNGETGTLSDWPNHYTLATTTATIKKGTAVNYNSYATTIPNGSELRSVNSGNGSGLSPSASYTQGTGSEQWNFYYYPFDYSITYDLAGGESTGVNPSSYNVLYGKSIDYAPVKTGYKFLGWNVSKNNQTYTMGTTGNWTYKRIYENCEPGVTYSINIDSAQVTSGSASQFATLIYDFTDSTTISNTVLTNFGSNIQYTITCPKTADPTHELILLIYSGINGSTANIHTKFTNVSVKYFSPVPKYSFNFNNTNFVKYAAINSSTGEYVTGSTNYTTTPDFIPIEGGTVLYSNMVVCGVYTYDSNFNFIKRESSYTKIHPISNNASYMRIEIAINTTPFETYQANFKLDNEMGINKSLDATFSNQSACYSELSKRTTGDFTFTALWEFETLEKQKIYLSKDGTIYARDFIQIQENVIRVDKNGNIYAPAFIEGNQISISPSGLIATSFRQGLPVQLYKLTDENGNILTDENNNILEAFIHE